MKLYDECLIFFLKNNACTDALPSTVQNDIFVLRNLYQIKRQYAEKAEIMEYWAFSHSLWWEDKLENIGTVCLDCDDGFLECYEGCLECYEWSEIEKEKKRGDVALEKMSEELAKLRDDVKEASMKIPNHLSHLTDRITSLCNSYIHFGV